ncbi:MAG: hypothetical protein EKK55_25020 [Rhodocyclaceae bacterium]|nr:MAG: hypothetical protein EKK55_25020 [Rhodocyclaceae bacterium]
MEKEGADRVRTGKPHPWARCGARRAHYQCGKPPGHPRKHRDFEHGFEWHDAREALLAEVDALNVKLDGGLRLYLPPAEGRPRWRVWGARLADPGVMVIAGAGDDRPLGGPNLELDGAAWAALLADAKVPPTATSGSGV